MTPPNTLIRATTVTAMVLAVLSWGTSSGAADPVPASASIGAVTCVEEQGRVVVDNYEESNDEDGELVPPPSKPEVLVEDIVPVG